MKRALALLLGIVLAGCGEGAALDRLGGGEVVAVERAVSGDAVLLVDGRVLRLAGIDAPNREEPYAQEARAALDALVRGRDATLLYGGAREDPFGRPVAHLRMKRDRAWAQGELLDAGAVRVRTYPDNRSLAAEMLAREARARAAGRGLWSLPDYQVRLPAEAVGLQGFQIVEGRVT